MRTVFVATYLCCMCLCTVFLNGRSSASNYQSKYALFALLNGCVREKYKSFNAKVSDTLF